MATTVTSQIQGITINEALKAPCATVSTTNITLAGYQTINGVTITAGSANKRVLVKGQTDPVENGIYNVDSSSWQRAKDFDGNRDVVSGARVLIRSSGINGAEYELTTADPIVIGTTALTFQLRYGANTTQDQTEAEISAVVTPTNTGYLATPIIDPRRYGAVLDDVTNDYTALSTAVTVAGIVGGRVIIPGKMAIASASLGTTGIRLPSNVEIVGIGREASRVKVTGTTACNLFVCVNTSQIRIADLTLYGNSQGTGTADGQAVQMAQTSAATQNSGNLVIERCRVTNFKGDYWVHAIISSGSTYSIDNIEIRYSEFIALNGNSRDPTSIGAGAYCMAFQGASTNTTSLVTNVNVHHNVANCSYIKGFGVAWHNTRIVRFHDNVVTDAGLNGASDDKASYAIFAYDNSGGAGARPDLIEFDDNVIVSPRSAGIYVASGNRIYARGNTITGQTDTSDSSLPKGAIAINGANFALVSGNCIEDCFGGVILYGDTTASVMHACDNEVRSVVANGYGIRLRTVFSGKALEYVATGNKITSVAAAVKAIYCQFDDTAGAQRLIIKDNPNVQGTEYCILQTSVSAAILDTVDVVNNGCVGNGATGGIFMNNMGHANTRLNVSANRVSGSFSSSGIMLQVSGARGLSLWDNTLVDGTSITTGFALKTDDAQGTMGGNRFINIAVARRIYSSGGTVDLGVDTPTHTGVQGDFVQKISPGDATGATWDYIITGWTYTTAWRAHFQPYQDA